MSNIVSNAAVDSVRSVQFNGTQVRIISADNALWFVASDVMKCIGVQNTTTAMQNLHEDECRLVPILGSRPMNALSERGIRKRLMRSRKPEASALLEWIEREAIPECREAAQTEKQPDTVGLVQRLAVRVAQLEQQLATAVLE